MSTMMISQELLHKIRLIKIQTRRLLAGTLIGNNRSSKKGYGLDFDQIREYQYGDDVRFIDWKSSARSNKIVMKEYKEERVRTIIVAVDISSSSFFASRDDTKYTAMSHIASVLALVAQYAQDHVGLLLFSQEVELYIPPKSGTKHVYTLLQHILTIQPRHAETKKTNIKKALEYLAAQRRKDTLVFLISDFIDSGYEKELKVAMRMYKVIAIRILDTLEHVFPAVGLLQLQDIEQETTLTVQVTPASKVVNRVLTERLTEQNAYFKQCGIQYFDANVRNAYIDALIIFLQRRLE